MRNKFIVFLFAFTLLQVESFGWGKKGHQIIAELAFKMLTPAQQKKLMTILKNGKLTATNTKGSVADPVTLDDACIWMDEVRHFYPKYEFMDNWHFYNVDKIVADDNVVDAINNTEAKIANGGLDANDLKEAYLVILHLVGDIHQPLHCSYKSDEGGNEYSVTCDKPLCKPYEKQNIHHVWDDEFIDHYNINDATIQHVIATISAQEKLKLLKESTKTWEEESFSYVMDKKNYPHPAVITEDYFNKYKGTVEMQLAEGALRLHSVLSNLLK